MLLARQAIEPFVACLDARRRADSRGDRRRPRGELLLERADPLALSNDGDRQERACDRAEHDGDL